MEDKESGELKGVSLMNNATLSLVYSIPGTGTSYSHYIQTEKQSTVWPIFIDCATALQRKAFRGQNKFDI